MSASSDLSSRDIRNIGILAHVDAGKTSITERILFLAGLRRTAGDVDEGTTATDYLAVERQHGITVKSAAVRFEWKNCSFHLIDTPGHVDFGNEVDRALRILDGAIIALCAVSGVQARTEVIVRACVERSLPRLYFINKMDRSGADFFGVIDELRSSLEPNAIAFQYPIFDHRQWTGIVDLVSMTAYRFGGGEQASAPIGGTKDLPDEAKVLLAREKLIEKLAGHDEAVLSLYASNREIPPETLRRALGRAAKNGRIVPVLCGSAFVDQSVRLLLDSVISFLPSPQEAAVPAGIDPRTNSAVTLRPASDESFSAFVFKTVSDASGEIYAWTRIWSGTMKTGRKVFDARSGKDVVIKKIFGIHADSFEELAMAGAGQIVAITADAIEPGASLCGRANPIVYEAFVVPEPVVSQVVEPATAQDSSKIRRALAALSVEDASLLVKEERETGRFEIAGQGELHLNIVTERLWRDFGLRVRVGNPRVNCRERLKTSARVLEEFDRDFGGARIRVTVELQVEASAKTAANEIVFAEGLRIQPQFIAAARRAAVAAFGVGPSEGWPLEGVHISILGLIPPGQSSGKNGETAVEAACARAIRKAFLQAGSEVLEPLMHVDIECPEESFGAVLNAISARNGRIESVEDGLLKKSISSCAPMRNLFGFASELRSISKGRAQFQARFQSYEAVRHPPIGQLNY